MHSPQFVGAHVPAQSWFAATGSDRGTARIDLEHLCSRAHHYGAPAGRIGGGDDDDGDTHVYRVTLVCIVLETSAAVAHRGRVSQSLKLHSATKMSARRGMRAGCTGAGRLERSRLAAQARGARMLRGAKTDEEEIFGAAASTRERARMRAGEWCSTDLEGQPPEHGWSARERGWLSVPRGPDGGAMTRAERCLMRCLAIVRMCSRWRALYARRLQASGHAGG